MATAGDHGISGGELLTVVTDAFAVSVQNARSLTERCHQLQDELMRRAQVCDEYELLVQQYRAEHVRWSSRQQAWDAPDADQEMLPRPGGEPTFPSPPEPWVVLATASGPWRPR